MKVTIELTEAEVKGLKAYLKDVGSVSNPTKQDIQREVQGIVSSYLQSPQSALTDYIRQYEHA